MKVPADFAFVVSIYPNSRGIAFVVFEGPKALVDWGMRGARHGQGHTRHLTAVRHLFDHYWPPILIVQDMSALGAHRCERIRALNEAITQLSEELGIPISSHSRAEVREIFKQIGAGTKAAIAEAIGVRIPALRRHVPPARRPWMSEHARMGIFDAAALALTFFASAGLESLALGIE